MRRAGRPASPDLGKGPTDDKEGIGPGVEKMNKIEFQANCQGTGEEMPEGIANTWEGGCAGCGKRDVCFPTE